MEVTAVSPDMSMEVSVEHPQKKLLSMEVTEVSPDMSMEASDEHL